MNLSINEYKNKIAEAVNNSFSKEWISKEDGDSILEMLNNDTLTIGVVGQMKVGKSSLVNSLVFGKNILPTSEIPMTATLTYISYGPKFSAKVEFISESDFNEVLEKKGKVAQQDITQAEIDAAQSIYDNIVMITDYNLKFGKTIELSDNNLEEYVGAEGKYTALTKCVTMYMPNESLKGVNIVDTPGFNDPVSSRNITTNKFLSSANVIIFVQDITSAFTTSDIDLLTEQVPQSGIGKIVIALNKKDLLNESDQKKVSAYAEEQRSSIINASESNGVSELLKNCQIIPISGVMAMIGNLSDEEINNDDNLLFLKEQIEFDNPSLQKEQYMENSGILELNEVISKIVLTQKEDLVLNAPMNCLLAMFNKKINKLMSERDSLEEINSTLEDQQLDLQSIIDDLNHFEIEATEIMSDTIALSNSKAKQYIKTTLYCLFNKRDKKVESIKFADKRDKTYLRMCYNSIDEKYREFNISIRNELRSLGGNISEELHQQTNAFESKLDKIVLTNAELIHKIVINQIRTEIDSAIPNFVSSETTMTATMPDYWDRCDIYNMGITRYFKDMLSNAYPDSKFENMTQKYATSLDILLTHMEDKIISSVIGKTKDKYSAVDVNNIDDSIEKNMKRISIIDNIVDSIKQKINQINTIIK